MHQKSFGGRAPPGPAGELTALPPDPLAGFKEKGRVGKGEEKKERGGEWRRNGQGKGRGGKGFEGREIAPTVISKSQRL